MDPIHPIPLEEDEIFLPSDPLISRLSWSISACRIVGRFQSARGDFESRRGLHIENFSGQIGIKVDPCGVL